MIPGPSFDPAAALALRLALAAVLAVAAWHKARHPDDFRRALAGYRLTPARWQGPAAAAVPALEIAVAATLAIPAAGATGAIAAASLFGVYSLAIAINLARGRREIDCACGDPANRQPISWALVARNAALVAVALVAALPGGDRALTALDAATIPAAAAVFALLYAGADRAIANAARARSWRRMA